MKKMYWPTKEKRLCRHCKHKEKISDKISPGALFYCKISKAGKTINPSHRFPYPDCPLRTGDITPEAQKMYSRGITL